MSEQIYFISDTGAAYATVAPKGLYREKLIEGMVKAGYREATYSEWLAKRREQRNAELREARQEEREYRAMRRL